LSARTENSTIAAPTLFLVTDGNLPPHLLSFIATCIRTVVELEALLLLLHHAPRVFSADELAREMRIDPQYAKQEMTDLAEHGLVELDPQSGCGRYAARTPELDKSVRELAQLYIARRVSVIQAIYTKPSDPIQSFADAFNFRKGKPNG
jgi:predicted ArsR family transcriptional regulator